MPLPLRLVTLHPALVHVPVGVAPLITAAFLLGFWRRSARWTRAADAMLVLAAPVTVLAALLGVVSAAARPWPAGLRGFGVAHQVAGFASAVLLVALAVARVRQRGEGVAEARWVALSALVSVLVLFTGWLGGEVLVFRAGIGVLAAGDGMLAPPVSGARASAEAPADVTEAMAVMRAAWADAQLGLDGMLLKGPDDAGRRRVDAAAHDLSAVAACLQSPECAGNGKLARGALADDDRQALRDMAETLEHHADALADAVERNDLPRAAVALGAVSASCASCHRMLRWTPPTRAAGRPEEP